MNPLPATRTRRIAADSRAARAPIDERSSRHEKAALRKARRRGWIAEQVAESFRPPAVPDQKRQFAGTYLYAAATPIVQPHTTGAPTAIGEAGRPVVGLTAPLPGVSRIGAVSAVASWPA